MTDKCTGITKVQLGETLSVLGFIYRCVMDENLLIGTETLKNNRVTEISPQL